MIELTVAVFNLQRKKLLDKYKNIEIPNLVDRIGMIAIAQLKKRLENETF